MNGNPDSINARVRQMAIDGASAAEIMRELGQGNTVATAIGRARRDGVLAPRVFKSREPSMPQHRPQTWLETARAGQWHLIDLKRAGHSPTKTEFSIPPDHGGRASVPIRPLNVSIYGSTGAWCAELGR